MTRLGDAVDALFQTIQDRRDADPDESYTARLLQAGPARAAKKLGEEGVETALAGALQDPVRLREESADLLYHLSVLWAACDVTPDEVAEVLQRREGRSGLAEKAARNAEG